MAGAPVVSAAVTREGRLKAALKANMARRKAQARGRAEGSGPEVGTHGQRGGDLGSGEGG
ncbi:hypothetical protein [Gemmobacter sp. 24YEA27]|uniref:hypothetical protein n=1 Tax=Gemmobacter sp. 24YEA27 TaxID=3040672 RepID=UPI0024B3370D|nr:hypothetical protein [Gemmobacter sp. 24YEA27]